MTEVEFAVKARGQFLMARGVRQGCPASGFLFAWFSTLSSDGSTMGSTTRPSQEIMPLQIFCNPLRVSMLMILLLQFRLSGL